MQKKIFISYSARYTKKTEKQIKQVEKILVAQMLKDAVFSAELLTTHQAKTNKIKVQKIVKLLVLNLIRAIHNNSELIISLDNNTLRQHNINLRLFSGVVNKLERMDYITIRRGFFLGSDKISKRSRVTAADKLKNLIIQHTTEYTVDGQAKLTNVKKAVINNVEKAKLTFTIINSELTISCFRDIAEAKQIVAMAKAKNAFILSVNNKSKIVKIKAGN